VNSAFFVSRDVLFLVGMGAAGLADVLDVRLLYLISSLMILAAGIWVLFLPGLGQPAEEWRRAVRLLRAAPAKGALGAGRAATLADLDALAGLLPSVAALSSRDRESLIGRASVVTAPAGATIVRHGEAGDAAYFVLGGRAVAGLGAPDGSYRALSNLQAGDFFGEIAALTGTPRTADVVADEPTTLLAVPAAVLRALMHNAALSQVVMKKMSERLARTYITDLPRFGGLEQGDLRELRTAKDDDGSQTSEVGRMMKDE
jgi:CRP-like cAMP-binding protein